MSYPDKPELAPTGERLRDRTAPLAPHDDRYGYAHAYLCGSLGAIFDEVAEVFDPEGDIPPMAPLLDPELCPDWALPWLAQFVGIVLPAGIPPDDARALIHSVYGFRRGTPAAMRAAAALYLTGTKTVNFRERDPDSPDPPYTLEVVTLEDELPETDLPLTNEAPNPSFEIDLANWSASKGGTANAVLTTFARQNGWKKVGSWSARYTATINAAGSTHYVNATTPGVKLPCVPNEWITATVSAKVLANTSRITLSINWLTAAGGYISSSNAPSIEAGQFGVFDMTATAKAPATAGGFNLTVQISQVIGTADMYLDAATIARRSEPVAYGDGSMPGWTWSGAPHASASVRVPTTLVRDALLALKPGGLILKYRGVAGWDYQEMTGEGGIYSALPTKFVSYRTLTNNERI